ncbi:MAG: TolC family protein [Verrucomicrobiota bacterium]
MRPTMALTGPLFQRVASCAVLVLALLFATGAAAQTGDITGTMPEDYLPELKAILETSFLRSPQVVAAEFERAVSEAKLDVANASRLPNVNGNLSYAVNQTAISSNASSQTRDNGLFYSLGVTQALFHWRALKNQTDAARINLLVAQKSYDLAARELGTIVRKAYLSLIVEKARLRQVDDIIRVMRDDLAVVAEKRDRGTVSPAVYEGDKLRLREVQLDVDRASAEFDANRLRFARLVGMDALSGASVPDQIPKPAFSPGLATALSAALLRNGAKSTLEWEIYDLRVREANLRHQIERVRLYPKFFASAGFSLENSTNVNGNAVNQQGIQRRTVSVYAQWNIFDGFATRGAVREALANKRVQERRLVIEAEGVLQNVQILERSLRLDAEQLDLSEIRHSLALESKRRTAEEVGLGNQAKGDIDRAENGVRQADAKSQESRAAFLGRWSEFVALAGADPVLKSTFIRHVREQK